MQAAPGPGIIAKPEQSSVVWLTNMILSDQLRENALLKRFYCDVNISDLINFNEELAHKLASEPADIIPLVRTHSFSECLPPIRLAS